MNAIEETLLKLKKYPDIKYKFTKTSVTIFPKIDSGFIVMIEKENSNYRVSFEGWHEEFENGEEALNCLAFGLSTECRLKVTTRGSSPQKWEVESNENGNWVSDSETGLIIFPFWRKAQVSYKQNTLIK